jgi:hypothetical protein
VKIHGRAFEPRATSDKFTPHNHTSLGTVLQAGPFSSQQITIRNSRLLIGERSIRSRLAARPSIRGDPTQTVLDKRLGLLDVFYGAILKVGQAGVTNAAICSERIAALAR